MRFEIVIEPFNGTEDVERVTVEADDWFSALSLALEKLERPYHAEFEFFIAK